jgi:5-methylcytosine-specific restriction endonuclease McrA
MKTCSKCHETKPLDAFAPRACNRDGLKGECRECTAKYFKEYAVAHAEHLRELGATWRAENAERKAAADAQWQRNNPEKCAAKTARWVAKNPEKKKKVNAASRAKHPETRAAGQVRWRALNPDKVSGYVRKHARKYPEKVNASQAKRRAIKLAAPGRGVTPAEWQQVLDDAHGICAYCGEAAHLTMDHVVSLVMGGAHDVTNLAAACQPCNSSKGARPLDVFLASRNQPTKTKELVV